MSLKLLLSMVPTPWLALVDLQLMAYLMIRKPPTFFNLQSPRRAAERLLGPGFFYCFSAAQQKLLQLLLLAGSLASWLSFFRFI